MSFLQIVIVSYILHSWIWKNWMWYQVRPKFQKRIIYAFNSRWRIYTSAPRLLVSAVITSHRQNHQKYPQYFWKTRKFATKFLTELAPKRLRDSCIIFWYSSQKLFDNFEKYFYFFYFYCKFIILPSLMSSFRNYCEFETLFVQRFRGISNQTPKNLFFCDYKKVDLCVLFSSFKFFETSWPINIK